MAFATNNDLVDLVRGIFDHCVEVWTTQLLSAQGDVERKIQAEWYNNRYYSGDWDPTLLTETQWTRATCYRALSVYILTQLTQWRVDGDSFQEQIDFYQEKFAEEMSDQFAIGIQYDSNEDGAIDSGEEFTRPDTRLWR